MAAQKKVDYDRIEPGWRAGLLSPAQLAAQYTEDTGNHASRSAIIKHFTKMGVPRDLSAKVRAKAEAMVSQAMVTGKVSPETIATEKRIVDGNATRTAEVAIRHRVDLSALWETAMAMLSDVKATGEHQDTLDEIAKLLAANDDGEADPKRLDRLREALQRACSLPGRVGSFKAIVDSITKLCDAERTAWKLDDAAEDANRGKVLSDAERASRLATILHRARERAPPTDPVPPAHARH